MSTRALFHNNEMVLACSSSLHLFSSHKTNINFEFTKRTVTHKRGWRGPATNGALRVSPRVYTCQQLLNQCPLFRPHCSSYRHAFQFPTTTMLDSFDITTTFHCHALLSTSIILTNLPLIFLTNYIQIQPALQGTSSLAGLTASKIFCLLVI